MEKTLLSASAKDEIVKVLGIEVANVNIGKLHVKINGIDLMRNAVLDDLQFTADINEEKSHRKGFLLERLFLSISALNI